MSEKDIQRKRQCSGCWDMKYCTVYWGRECSRNGGQRIPRMQYRDWNKQDPKPQPKPRPNPVITAPTGRRFLGIVPVEVLLSKEVSSYEEVN